MLFSNGVKKEKNNWNKWIILWLIVFVFLSILKEIIKSWYLLYSLLIIVLLILARLLYNWIRRKNMDKPASLWYKFRKKYPIITQYWPPKWINPAEAWLLYNLKVDPTDLTSLVYQRKFEWLIDVKTFVGKNSKKEYIKLIKIEDIPVNRPVFETEIFDSIFALWHVKIIEWAFQLRYALMLEDLELRWIKKWWVVKQQPSIWLEVLYWILVPVFFLSVYSYFTELLPIYPKFWFLVLLLFIICVLLWWYIGWWSGLNYTDKWAELASYLIWYKKNKKSCDEAKIRVLLKDDPLFVDRTLPYATAFWMETEFLNKISPLKSDRTAKYAWWKKVLPWMWFFRLLFKSDDDY